MSGATISGIAFFGSIGWLLGVAGTTLLWRRISRLTGEHGTQDFGYAVLDGAVMLFLWPPFLLIGLCWLLGQSASGRDWPA